MRWAAPIVLFVAFVSVAAYLRRGSGPPPPVDLPAVVAEVAAALNRQYDRFDTEALAARLDRVRPLVEAQLGGPAGDVKIVRLSPDAWIAREVRRTRPEEPSYARMKLWGPAHSRLGEYWAEGGAVVVFPDNLLAAVPDDALDQALDFVLARQLVHAWQHRRFDLARYFGDTSGAARLARRAAIEGHAAHVAAAVGDASAHADGIRGLEGIVSASHEIDFRLRAGARFFEAVARKHGAGEAIRRIFERPPASTREILRPAEYLAGTGPDAGLHALVARAVALHDGDPPVVAAALAVRADGLREALRMELTLRSGALRDRWVAVLACEFETPDAALAHRRVAAPPSRHDLTVFPKVRLAAVRGRLVLRLTAVVPVEERVFLERLAKRLLAEPVPADPGAADPEARLAALRAGRFPPRLLDDPDPEVRLAVVEATDDPDLLRTGLNHSDPVVRAHAAHRIEDPRILAPALDDPAADVRAAVVYALGEAGWSFPPAVIAKLAADPAPRVRMMAADAADPEQPDWRDLLVRLAKDPEPSVRRAAWQMLDETPRRLALGAIRDSDPYVRGSALFKLALYHGDTAAAEHAVAGLEDDNLHVRRHAALALGILGSDVDLTPLLAQLHNGLDEPATRMFLPMALRGARAPETDAFLLRMLVDPIQRGHAFSALPTEREDFVPVLRALLRDWDDARRAEAALALRKLERTVLDLDEILKAAWRQGGLGADRHLEELVKSSGLTALPLALEGIEDVDPYVREAACRALGSIPRLDDASVERIGACLRDPEHWVRRTAASVLARLGPRVQVLLPELVHAALHEADDDIAARVRNALTELGPAARPALPELRKAKSRGGDVGKRAALAIAAIK